VEGSSHGKRLLVLGAGPAQLGLLAAARQRGLYVIAVDRDASAPGFRHADRRAIISTEDELGIERLASAERVDGLIAPGIDWPVGIAARVAAKLGLPHPLTAESGVLATSKLRQRDRFAEVGIQQPLHETCRSVAEAREAAERVGYPCVVKAPDQQGQRGLSVVESPEELDEAAEAALEASRSSSLLVEELVEGREITVNAFSLDGQFYALTVTDRHLAEQPAFGVALAHVWPSAQPPLQIAQAIDAARRAAAALGIANGPTYTQVLVSEEGAFVGELAARLGGGHDAELCRAALGVDLNDAAIAVALGEPLKRQQVAPKARVGGACVRFLVPPVGELREVTGLEEAYALDGILGIRMYRRPGHVFGPLRRGSDRAGAILAVGDSAEDALARADEAADLIRFETADVDTEALA
jgi:biotin carboxylase